MKCRPVVLAIMVILSGCAINRVDHFYSLSVQPGVITPSQTSFARQVSLHVTLPSLVDRGELVLTSRDQATILEHERWASPLLDQFTSTLGQDIEARRRDVVIANRSIEQSAVPLSSVSLEVVRISAQRGGKVSIETRWRIVDSVTETAMVGRNTVSAPMTSSDYAQLAAALSGCVAQLADILLAALPAA